MFSYPRVKELFNLISGKKEMKKSKMNKTSLRLTISNIHSGLFSKTILLVSIFLGEVLFPHFPYYQGDVSTGHKVNAHKTFRRRPGRLLKVLCTFNLRPVSRGFVVLSLGAPQTFS